MPRAKTGPGAGRRRRPQANRTFVWMPLATDSGAPPANVSRPTANAQAMTPTDDNHSKETFPVPNPTHNGRHPSNGDPDPTITQATLDPLSEAEAIRGLLSEVPSQLSR